jgi:hypothetical protein
LAFGIPGSAAVDIFSEKLTRNASIDARDFVDLSISSDSDLDYVMQQPQRNLNRF